MFLRPFSSTTSFAVTLRNRFYKMSSTNLPTTYGGIPHIAVIGGTGLESLENFHPVAQLNIDTPWGKPSSPITISEHPSPTTGHLIPIAFLARHGVHHELAPHEVPARANIAALRSIGVRCIIAFSAAGSLQEEVKPRDFVVPDQVIDRTKGIRPFTFFEGGFVCHVPFADPFDAGVGKLVRKCGHSLEGEGVVLHDKGTVICMGMASPLCVVIGTTALILLQRDRSSAHEQSRICIGYLEAQSLTCQYCQRLSWRLKRRSRTRWW